MNGGGAQTHRGSFCPLLSPRRRRPPAAGSRRWGLSTRSPFSARRRRGGSGCRSSMTRARCAKVPSFSYQCPSNGQAGTHPFKNGVPRLHENWYPPTWGGSVETRFAVQDSTLLTNACPMKSRGSTGNIFPPISNAIVWDSEQENVLPSDLRMLSTMSAGPRSSELP